MNQERRFHSTIRAIRHRWPAFLSIYGGFVLAVAIIGVGLLQMWLAFIPIALALMIVLGFYFMGRVWSIYNLYDSEGIRPEDKLFDLGNIQDTETIVYLDYGERYRGLKLVRRLSSGKLIFVDLYNPNLMPNPMLVRLRREMPTAVSDPRLSWKESQLGLLPLPDESVSVVVMCDLLSELAQRGDQKALLEEIYRVMKPYGRLLFCERTNSTINRLLLEGFQFHSSGYWQRLIREAGFTLQREVSYLNLIHCFRIIKPTPYEARQMAFDLSFDE